MPARSPQALAHKREYEAKRTREIQKATSKGSRHRKLWDSVEDDIVRASDDTSLMDLAFELGRSYSSVRMRRRYLRSKSV